MNTETQKAIPHILLPGEDMPVTHIPLWRERLRLARESGSFTASDRLHIESFRTCAVGEGNNGRNLHLTDARLNKIGLIPILRAFDTNNFDAFESLLNAIDVILCEYD